MVSLQKHIEQQIESGQITLKCPPLASRLSEITLKPTRNVTSTKLELGIESFKQLMAMAKALDARDPDLVFYHLAPWYRGSFVALGETYLFDLYLGGRGKITSHDGKFGWFQIPKQ